MNPLIHEARSVYREAFMHALTGTATLGQVVNGKRDPRRPDALVENAHQIATSAVSTIFGEDVAQEISNADLSAWESK